MKTLWQILGFQPKTQKEKRAEQRAKTIAMQQQRDKASEPPERELVSIGVGKLCLIGYGSKWAKTNLREVYKSTGGNSITLSITPPCEYQIKQGWPEPPFVNINTYRSTATTKSNWLGCLDVMKGGNEEKNNAVKLLLKILETKDVAVSGKIVHEGNGYYKAMLFLSESSLQKIANTVE